MPVYTYKATNKEGKLEKGTISASNKRDVAGLLKDRELKLLAVKEEKKGITLFQGTNIPMGEKVTLCRYLGLIIRSGLSLSEGLNLLASGTTNKNLRRVLDTVATKTRQGTSLYGSFQEYERQFGKSFITVIKTGETAGTLAESFEYLASQFQQEKELKGKVMSSLLYPAIIIGLMFAVGIVLFTFVLPQLAGVFTKMNVDLPYFTELMFNTSLYFQKNMILVLGAFAALILLLVLMIKSRPGRDLIKNIMVRLPVVKHLIRDYNLVRFTQSLAALLKSGVPVTEAVELSTQTLSFIKVDKLVIEFNDKLTRGVSLSQAFADAKIFPPLMVQLITIGEKTGNLESMLSDLSEFYEEEVENSLKNFVTALEPTLLILVGVGVGVMVVSVISPIYSLVGQLQAGL
ncbi:type II secretion system F family protein [Candidatus Roizmanbacteria bacterium]|nr:type II secretion system F family protein [Candidatus Roizmanbacteria bacterium]